MEKIIAIFGMPRSGTSYLGQILDSNINVAYRLEPIFSYKFKNIVDENSSKNEFRDFFIKAFEEDNDEFMNQLDKKKNGFYPIFQKSNPKYLVFKTTRFHKILPKLLSYFDSEELKIISLVRHPAGAIYSWISNPKEFPQEFNYSEEWRSGRCRKTAKEEFWGFEDWKKVMLLHTKLENKHKNFKIFQYENIVQSCIKEVKSIFKFVGLEYSDQTEKFLFESQSKHIADPYAVYKNKSVAIKWMKKLDKDIQNQIINETKKIKLERFLVEI